MDAKVSVEGLETLLKEADEYEPHRFIGWRIVRDLASALRSLLAERDTTEAERVRLVVEATKQSRSHAATTELLGRTVIRAEQAEAHLLTTEAAAFKAGTTVILMAPFSERCLFDNKWFDTLDEALAAYRSSQAGSVNK